MIRFEDDFDSNSKFLVIGIGGAALGVVNTIARWKLKGIETAFIDTKTIKDLNLFVNSLPQAEITFTVTGFGGATGTEATPYLIDLLKKRSLWVWSLLTLPFFFEGKTKIVNSLKGLKRIQALADAVLVIPHDKVFKMVDENIQMYKAFLPASDVCTKLISSIHRLTVSPSWINIEFSDIKTRLKDKNSTAFGIGESSGNNKVHRAIEVAVADVLLGKELISRAKSLVVSILGGEDLKLKEIENGIEFLRTFVPKEVHLAPRWTSGSGRNISFGVATDKSWNGKVQISIIALGLDSDIKDISNNWDLSIVTESNVQAKEKVHRQPISRSFRVSRPFTKPQQTTIDFKSSLKGRFDKSKPTMYEGEDLDIPTFLRRKRNIGTTP